MSKTDPQQSKAPALDNGLTILEMASNQAVGFNDLVEQLDVSRGTVSRILKILHSRNYLKKTADGKYILGDSLSRLMSGDTVKKQLKEKAAPYLNKLTTITKCPSILFFWDGHGLESIAKYTEGTELLMQELGSYSTDLSRYPWGWLLYATMTLESQRNAQDQMHDKNLLSQGLAANPDMTQKGYAFDQGIVAEQQYRLATLIRNKEHRIIGAFGLGGTPQTMPNDKIELFSLLMIDYASDIAAKL